MPLTPNWWWVVVVGLLFIGGLKAEGSNETPKSLATRPWSYGDSLLMFSLWAVVSHIDLIPAIAELPALTRTAVTLVSPAGIVLIALWVLLRARYHASFGVLGFASLHRAYYVAWSSMVIGACLAAVASAATVLVWITRPDASLVGLPGPPQTSSPLHQYLHQASPELSLSLVIVAYVAVLGPLLEEIMFRALFIGPFARRFGIPVAAIVSATLWAAGHVGAPIKLIVTCALGLAFSYLYIRTGSLVPPICLHVAGNVSGVILPVVWGLTNWQTLLLPLVVFGLLLLIVSRALARRLVPADPARRLAWSGTPVRQEEAV